MDTLLKDNDHATREDGHPVTIRGGQAFLQRLLIRLRVRLGSFSPDPALGSELYRLPASMAGEERDRLALHYAQQALLPERVRVESASCRPIPGKVDALAIALSLRVGGRPFPLEVAI
ncbi:MAG: histidine kinase [Oscillospiraceae bacterium]|nr:histidine kinase [Oscillospiraceae bacterium]